MKTLILINIVSSNTVYRINSYIDKYKTSLGKVLVLFCAETEANRRWVLHEKINFEYKILKNKRIEIGKSDLFTYFLNFSAWNEFNDFKPDRIILSGWDQFAYQLAYVWALVNKKKITLWSGSTINEFTWRRFITWPLVSLMVRMSDRYIAYGTMAKRYLTELGAHPRKISIYTNDVNRKYFKTESAKFRRKRSSIKKFLGIRTRHNFIYVGQIIERKNVMSLLESFRLFKNNNPDWGLVIVGYGKQERLIRDYVKKEKIQDIRILSNVEQYDLPKIYTACDCLVLPSLEEVWGLVVNEALYCGLKVIVSDKCGCAPDLVKEGINGYVFKAGDENDLNIKMEMVASTISTPSKRPFFSIITCTRNSFRYISKNIFSVKKQTFKNYEHIFIDGKSSDGTEKVIADYIKGDKDKRRALSFRANGISDAFNKGVKASRGEYLLFLNSDDSFRDTKVLSDTSKYLSRHKMLDWIYGIINVVEDDGRSVGLFPKHGVFKKGFYWLLKYVNYIPHQSVFMKKSVFERYGSFDDTLSSKMDYEYWLRVGEKTRWVFFDRQISNYSVRKDAQTSSKKNFSVNKKNMDVVQRKYMNRFQLMLSGFIFRILLLVNRTLRY